MLKYLLTGGALVLLLAVTCGNAGTNFAYAGSNNSDNKMTASELFMGVDAPVRRALEKRFQSQRSLATFPPSVVIRLDAQKLAFVPGSEPNQIGFSRDIPKRFERLFNAQASQWQAVADGGSVWTAHLITPGAAALRLGIAVESLPSQAVLSFSTSDPEQRAIRITGDEINATIARNRLASEPSAAGNLFWTPTLEGESAIMQIYLPAGVAPDDVDLNIPKLSQIVEHDPRTLEPIRKIGESSPCNIDVSCYWRDVARSVAAIQFVTDGDTYVCSGTLMNDKDTSTWRPYFLTGNHCISDQATASTAETLWFYTSRYCNGPPQVPVLLRGGADLLFTAQETDTTLLELRDQPREGFLFSGWNANPLTGSEDVFGIHHPMVDLKKISLGWGYGFFDCTPFDADGMSWCDSDPVGKFMGVEWYLGITEPGSSGSGLFMEDEFLIGTLMGGSSSCDNPAGPDIYGRFDKAFALGLDKWLVDSALPYQISVAAGDIDADPMDEFAVAYKKGDKVTLYYYEENGALIRSLVQPDAKAIDIAAGDFDADGRDEFALATIDMSDNLSVYLLEADGSVLGHGMGGKADSVTVAAGQLDADPADEYVVGLVQSDGRVAAISFNADGSRVGKAVALEGILPDVDVGDFDTNPSDREYIISYLSSTSTLETATFQGDGSRIGRGTGGVCSDITVAAGDFNLSTIGDEYAVSLVQSDTTLALISFVADGTRIGKGVGGRTEGPRVTSGLFPSTRPLDGLAVSLIQSDSHPVAIFFDGAGNRLGKGISPYTGLVADIATGDVDGDGFDEAIVAYVDAIGQHRWSIFRSDGSTLRNSN